AYHPQLDRYLALKVLRSDLVEEQEFLARFQREARAVAGLRHANIVQIYDFDVQDDLYYMAMELLEGDTLKAHLNAYRTRGERIPLGEGIHILIGVLDGLAYAHSENIIHRDIKPANILLTGRGQAVITDFGIAQIIGGTQYTVTGALMGTLNYMAPEQGLEGHCDPRSDIYSLGIVFYEMLTGHTPFDADTPLAILMKHLNDPLVLPRKIDPQIPEAMERVVLKALAKHPDDRYQSADEMKQALVETAQEAAVTIPEALSAIPTIESRSPAPEAEIERPAGAVFSGPAREHITDRQFANDVTDSDLRQRFGPEGLKLFFKLSHEPSDKDLQPKWLVPLAVSSGLALIMANIVAIVMDAITPRSVFGALWPMELGLVGLILSCLMYALAQPGLLIPTVILLTTGSILAYTNLTGWWWQWMFLWVLEVAGIGAAIAGAVKLIAMGKRGRWISRRLGLVLVALCSLQIFVMIWSGLFAVMLGR
ncbi:MAG: serine/threonine protein kinase, partial [Anaerolineales bacterium]|nr:serine/threonine protein kinase [Anaerolineales bacterium]